MVKTLPIALLFGLLGMTGGAGGAGCATALTEQPELHRFEFERPRMGTLFRVVLYAPDAPTANSAAEAAFDRIDQLNATLSDYDPQSELSRLSRSSGSGAAVPISDDLWTMLEMSRRISEQAGGAFDITVGPVIKLWRRARRQERLPDPRKLAEAMEAVGDDKVVLDARERTAKLISPGMKLDLGGIAKGYAADEALGVLRERGISRALIAAGGDVVVGDPPPGQKGWVVAVKAMVEQGTQRSTSGLESTEARYLLLRNAAVSTSGDAFQYVVIDGKRYSHIVDPRTGLGLTTPMGVTVISRSGTVSDAYATAAAVLGPERGMEIVDDLPGAAAIVQRLSERGEVEVYKSRGVRDLEFVEPRK